MRIVFLIISMSLTVSCASVPMATETDDANAKKFEIPEGKSRIYVFRNEYFAGAVKTSLTLDSKLMGQTGPYTYFAWDVEPGRHLVSCLGWEARTVEIFTKKGKATFVREEELAGNMTRGPDCKVYETSEEDGRNGVTASKLIK